jgi:hypothetical protein
MTVGTHLRRWILPAALALAAVPAEASASQSDIAATHAVIQAGYVLAKAGVSGIPAVQAKIEALNASLARTCPRAGAGSGEDEATQPMAHEITSDLWAIAYGYNARPIATFVAKVKRLRWSNPGITRAVEHEARSLHEMATLRQPDLCADVRAWAASGFTVIPPGVVALDERAEGIQFEELPLRGLLAPYERGSDKTLVARIEAYVTRIEEEEFSLGQADWYQILETLGMNP